MILSVQFLKIPRVSISEIFATVATLKIIKKNWVYVVADAAVIVIFILVVVDVGIKN